jgi:hypothetical protein
MGRKIDDSLQNKLSGLKCHLIELELQGQQALASSAFALASSGPQKWTAEER